MRRRELLTALVGAMATSAVRATGTEKTYRLAFVSPSQPLKEMTEVGFLGTFFKELRRLGYIEGENLVVLRFSAGGDPTRYDSIIGEVIRAVLDVVVTVNSPLVLRFKALMQATPIVALMGDPVAWGIVPNLARPGGNITGISSDAGEELWGKRLAMPVEAVPATRRVGFLCTAPFWDSPQGSMVREAAQQSSVKLIAPPLQGMYQDPKSPHLRRVSASRCGGCAGQRRLGQLRAHSSDRRFGATCASACPHPSREFVTAGGLMAYAFDVQDMFHRPDTPTRASHGRNPL